MPASPIFWSLTFKDWLQLVVPFIAAAGAVAVTAFSQRERVACAITWGIGRGMDGGPDEFPYVVVHNRTALSVAVIDVRYRSGLLRRPSRYTALDYEDPSDISFPYLVEPGSLKRLRLSQMQAKRLASEVSAPVARALGFFRRHLVVVEVTTTTGRRRRVGAEPVLPWKDRAAWLRGPEY